jgi:hypothetical protein
MQYPPPESDPQSHGETPVTADDRALSAYPTRDLPAVGWLGAPPVLPEWKPSSRDWIANRETARMQRISNDALATGPVGTVYPPPTASPILPDIPTSPAIRADAPPRQHRHRRFALLVALILLALLLAGGGGAAYWGYGTYTQMNRAANDGAQHLRDVRALLLTKKRISFTTTTLKQALSDTSTAERDFQQLDDQLQGDAGLISVAGSLPGVGKTARALPPVARMALDVSSGSHDLLDALYQLSQGLPQALSTKGTGMTAAQFQQINTEIEQAQQAFTAAQTQRHQFSPADLPGHSLRSSIAEFDALLPKLNSSFALARSAGTLAPALLGVTQPASYLLEIMDSTELRASGGFIGNYGIVKLSHAKLAGLTISDTYLLDRPYLQTHPNSNAPSPYASWWPFQGIWALRDSNLSPDFPTTARLGEAELAAENSEAVNGVIAITPGFVQQLLKITGPIRVPEYHETITPANLEDRIHFYQRHESLTESLNLPPQDQISSVEKRFTALFGRDLFAALRALPESKRAELFPLVLDALADKDLQVYFNNPQAEQLLAQLQDSDAVLSPAGDSLFVVDTNIGAAKANPYIDEQYHDTIALDARGGAMHTLVILYHYARNGPLYGTGTGYLDHMRIYVPRTAQFRGVSGCPTSYAPSQEVGHTVFACQFYIGYRDYQTITFRWYVPGVATRRGNQWRYNLLVQKQAGNTPLAIITATPPPGATLGAAQSLFSKKAGSVISRHAIRSDWSLWFDYAL